MNEDQLYTIVRYYQRGFTRVVRRGVTLQDAQAHCNDRETASNTCTSASGKRRTAKYGPWFDGFRRGDA
jgi:hypothetical protein